MAAVLEERLQETGKWLYQLIEGESPTLFQKEFWIGKVLDWCMRDETFRVEMFRFIDVFPTLNRPESVARHLQEYFSRPEVKLPSALQWGVKFVSPTSFAAKMVAKSFSDNIASMAQQFILGRTPPKAVPVLERLRALGVAFTADLLGEAVVSEQEAEEYFQRYLELFDVLHEAQQDWAPLGDNPAVLDWGHSPKVNVSIKVSAMYSQMNACAFDNSVAMAKERLRPLFRKAVSTEAFVNLDMEHHGLKNLTLALYRSIMEEPEFRDYPHTGIAIQCYRRDSEEDLNDLIQWGRKRKIRFTTRLVKGAYWDSEVIWARQNNWPIPVFTTKPETDVNFEKLARIILQNHERVRLACASHNLRAIAYVMEAVKELRTPPEDVEYQVIYGMGEPIRNALRKAGLPVRVYAPMGEMLQGMAYLVRRLLENTANESFLRQGFVQGVAIDELLRSPVEILKEHAPSSEPQPAVTVYGDKGPFQNEPLWDWTLAQPRERFAEALKRVRKGFPRKVPLIIGGKLFETGKEIISVNPNAPDEVVGRVAAAGIAEAEQVIQAAKAAFPGWRDTDFRTRAEYLFQAASHARRLRCDLAALQVFEVGKAWREADADVCEAIDFLEYYGREMLRLGPPERMGRMPGELSHLVYEPKGVAVVIAPWNFPLAISVGMSAAALVTGNTVVYKPASQSPVIGAMLHELFKEAKLPLGVLNFLPGSGSDIGDHLVAHPDVALIAFTGSKETGLHIVELASRTCRQALGVKTVIAEMGGKNAIIIDADADLDEAVVHILHSAFGYQGQKCSACSRLIVLEENYDRLLERLQAAAGSLHLGPVENPVNALGAVIDSAAQQKILAYIAIGKEEGTLILQRDVATTTHHSSPITHHSGAFFVPLTIFADIRPEHRLAQEEIFGPVLAVMKVKDFEQALAVANSTQYALTGAVFSRSPENIARARKDFRVGNLYINRGCTGALVQRHPFGGFKMSGIGSKAGGPDYLRQFMTPRNIVENTLRRGFAPPEE
jgi:RHH-type transcriptional regulator, proline utilization regulon repressor / proline dehydrogenase / delta 1-pyrroline-5-carboxylate dehydrogenase